MIWCGRLGRVLAGMTAREVLSMGSEDHHQGRAGWAGEAGAPPAEATLPPWLPSPPEGSSCLVLLS